MDAYDTREKADGDSAGHRLYSVHQCPGIHGIQPNIPLHAADFSVPVSFAGYVSAAYTLAAVISGIGAFFWIGGVEKRRFLLLNVTLLGVTTLLIAATQQFYWLLALRLLAGLLGGTTMGVGIGLLLNAAPAALHGRMLATVIASFSLVSIVGMPGMLYLCEVASWRAALVTIGGLCLLAAVLVALFVPRMRRSHGLPRPSRSIAGCCCSPPPPA